MRRILIGLAAGVLGVVGLAGAADAHGPGRHGHEGRRPTYHREYGHRFRGGRYYVGHEHPRWARRVWNPTCGRYECWDAGPGVWYYWYAPAGCWYPVTYRP